MKSIWVPRKSLQNLILSNEPIKTAATEAHIIFAQL